MKWRAGVLSISLHVAVLVALAWPSLPPGPPPRRALPSIAVFALKPESENQTVNGKAERDRKKSASKSNPKGKPDRRRPVGEEASSSADQNSNRADIGTAKEATAQWQSQLAASIERVWQIPPGSPSGTTCKLSIQQTPAGVVTDVSVRDCDADQRIRASLELAVRQASPLPLPPDDSTPPTSISMVVQVD